MVKNFQRDLKAAQAGEVIAEMYFSQLTDKYQFKSVAADPAYYHKGDILAIEKATGREVCIEVKCDSRIAQTQNVLLEDEVDYFYGKLTKGNLHSDYEIYAIVSPANKKIYVLDFKVLKQHYRKGEYKIIAHEDQASFCYLLPLDTIEKLGGIIAIIDYEFAEVQYLRENVKI